jgi:hypothetical protein
MDRWESGKTRREEGVLGIRRESKMIERKTI